MERIKNIEFLRFLMIFDIVMFHFFNKDSVLLHLTQESNIYNFLGKTIGHSGQTCVDFFFIIAGFFLLMTYNKSITVIEFIQKKVIRLFPVILFLWIAYRMISYLGIVKFDFYSNLLSLFMINNIGLSLKHGCMAVTWYVSVLLAVSIFYFYIIKHFEKKYTDLFIILVSIIGYSFLVHAGKGHIAGHIYSVSYIFNLGIIRGLAGMGCGIIIANLYKEYKYSIDNFKPNFKSFLVYTAFEVYLFVFLINNLTFHRLSYNNDIILILYFIVLFSLFILKRGFLSKILESKLSEELGKYTYSIFLTHLFVIRVINFFYWKQHIYLVENFPICQILLALSSCLLFGVFTYHFIEKPAQIYLKKLFNNNSFSDNRGGGQFLASFSLI